ncbi:hypothetical protein ACOSQ4_019132 [Xanthoceras sorbifolium]
MENIFLLMLQLMKLGFLIRLFVRNQRYTEEKASAPIYQVSKERAHSLGITYIPPEVSLKDTVESLKERNFINA